MNGWWTLADFYGFEVDHSILFCYVAQNAFHITVYMGDVPKSGVNRYLDEVEGREPLRIGPFNYFSIKLSRVHVHASFLVSLAFLFKKNDVPYIIFLLFTYYLDVLEGYICCIF